MKIVMSHENGLKKTVKIGFSWTTFLFGFLVPLIRGDLRWAGILFILQLCAGMPTLGIGAWIVCFIFAYKYNKIYISGLIEQGYQATTEENQTLVMKYLEGGK